MATKKRKKVGPPSPAIFAAQDAALSSAHTAHTARAASIAAADKHKSAVAQGNARKIASTHKAMRAAMAVSSAADAHSDTLDRARHSTVNADLARRDQSKPKKGSAVLASIEATVTRARAAKHKKIQAMVNKHLGDSTAAFDRADAHLAKRTRHQQERIYARMQTDAALVSAEKHAAKAATLKKQLPQGYAMVFGKLRKINPKGARKGAALLKR